MPAGLAGAALAAGHGPGCGWGWGAVRALSGRCRGTAGLAGRRRAALNFSRALAGGLGGTRGSWAALLSLSLPPGAERCCSGSAGRAGAGGLRSPRAALPPPRSRPPGPRQSAGLPGMPPGPRVGAARAARPASSSPPPRGPRSPRGPPAPCQGGGRGGWSPGAAPECRGVGTQHPKTKDCQSEMKYAPSTSRGTEDKNGETEAGGWCRTHSCGVDRLFWMSWRQGR